MSNIHEKCAINNAYRLLDIEENSNFIQEMVTKNFENGFAEFLPDMNGKKLTKEEEGAFSLGFIQGYKTALNYAVRSLSKKEIKSECFNSYEDFADFVNNLYSSGAERSFESVSCCDIVIDCEFRFYNIVLSTNGTIFFRKQKDSDFFQPIDASSIRYPIHIIKFAI